MNILNELGRVVNSETMFTKEEYGKPISERLSSVLRRNASKNDYANVSIQSKVSYSTIRDVVYRTNSLTKINAKALSLLIHAAFENSIASKIQSEADMIYLNEFLKL